MSMENMNFILTIMGPYRIRVVIHDIVDGEELGSLYFEKAKLSFQRKPITMDGWGCVEAKIEKLFDKYTSVTPKDIVAHCQDKIKKAGL